MGETCYGTGTGCVGGLNRSSNVVLCGYLCTYHVRRIVNNFCGIKVNEQNVSASGPSSAFTLC